LTCLPQLRAGEERSGPFGNLTQQELDDMIELHYVQQEEFHLVLLPTSVTDKRGRVVRGLNAGQFSLFEDTVAQEIRYFSSETAEPVSIAFLLDVSGSMRQLDKLGHAKAAIRSIVEQLGPDDRVGLICFADEQVVWVTEFTSDRERFLRRLDVQRGFGQTALNDAVAMAPGLVDQGTSGRKAMILITDGVDNSSALSMEQAISTARKVSMPIYTVGLLSVHLDSLPRDYTTNNLEVLEQVANETGGRLFAVGGPGDLKEAIVILENELRHQYLIGYYTSSESSGYHQLDLQVKPGRYQVRTRRGFWGKDSF
jgi:VWFA-related protein